MVNDKISTGETVSAVLKNAVTGEASPKYKVEVTVTNLATGEKHTYEVNR